VSDNGTRRYFNLAGVVRDLEHIRATGGTPEGRDLWDRWVAIQDEAFAEAMDADYGAEDDLGSHTGDEPGVGDGESSDGAVARRGPGGDAEGIDEVRTELARLASALANLTRPEGGVPPGSHPVDGTRGAGTLLTKRRMVGAPNLNVNEEVVKNAETPRPRKRRAKTKKRTR